MGYRDDELAFNTRRDLLAEEVDTFVKLRADLEARRDASKERLRRARFKLALLNLWGWMGRHLLFIIFCLVVISITISIKVNIITKERAHEKRLANILGHGCKSLLSVSALASGRVYLNGVRMGKTPVQRSICPGHYLVWVVGSNAIPWQRNISVGEAAKVTLRANLISRNHRPKGAMVIHSVPDNALVFINGREVGITPVLVRDKLWRRPRSGGGEKVLVGIWAPGRPPRAQRIRFARDVWFQLPPALAEAKDQESR